MSRKKVTGGDTCRRVLWTVYRSRFCTEMNRTGSHPFQPTRSARAFPARTLSAGLLAGLSLCLFRWWGELGTADQLDGSLALPSWSFPPPARAFCFSTISQVAVLRVSPDPFPSHPLPSPLSCMRFVDPSLMYTTVSSAKLAESSQGPVRGTRDAARGRLMFLLACLLRGWG